jgi:hypothetical protein
VPRLAVTDHHQHLQLLTYEDGETAEARPLHAEPRPLCFWPAWSPVEPRIAYSRVDRGEHPSVSIEVATLSEAAFPALETVHAPKAGTGMIAPRIPHYVMWSPDARKLSFVGQSQFGLTLFLHYFEGAVRDVTLLNAAPIFSAWQRDSNFLLVHHGTSFGVIETDGSNVLAPVSEESAGYRAPSARHDSDKLAFAEQGPDGVVIKVAEYQGVLGREVWHAPGLVAFDWSPAAPQLLVARAPELESPAFDELWVLEGEGDERRLYADLFVAFFWSPDGSRIALLCPWVTDGRLYWRVLDGEGRQVCQSEPFAPSPDFQVLVAFFDQYSRSHAIWSGDSRYVAFAGKKSANGIPSMFGADSDVVLVMDAATGATVPVGRGQLAFWEVAPA